MSDSIIPQLLDFGVLGIFASFLIWQYLGMQKRLDKMIDDFQRQIREIDALSDTRIEAIRERYDRVLEDQRTDALTDRKLVGEKIDTQTEILRGLSAELNQSFGELKANHQSLIVMQKAKDLVARGYLKKNGD